MIRADLLVLNGRVLTFAGRAVQALAVIGDRVAATGGSDELLALRGPRTRVVDLHGRLAVPGFTDSHVHLAGLSRRLSQVELSSAATLTQALRLIAARARRTPSGKWLTGGGFDKNRWGEGFPTREHLDRVALDHPVAVRSRDGHAVWANSRALRACGITARTLAPPGGVIVRDARGRPTGILLETATSLIHGSPRFEARPASTHDLGRALRHLLKQGITSLHLMEEGPVFEQLQALRSEGRLTQRVTVYRPLSALDDMIAVGIKSGLGDEWLRVGGVKLLMDGTLGSQTAWLTRPYENRRGGYLGLPLMAVCEMRRQVTKAAEAGLACAVHAIGDRATAEVLDVFEGVRDHRTPLPHRLEHAQLLRPQDIPRFARLGVVASMQPCHILGDIGPAERYWGRRSRYAYALRSLVRAGATLAFGSDAPVETANPLAGIYAAVARQTLDGGPKGGWYRKEEGIGVGEALRAYAVGPATATGESRFKGRLAPGYLADIVVLSHDIGHLSSRALLDVSVDLVVLGGRIRYRGAGAEQ